MTTFKAIGKKVQISKLVEADIEEAIRSKKFVTGTKLPSEHVLCRQFGVSRTAVREALSMLSARGLVSVQKGRGVFVRKMSADTVTIPLHLYLQLTYDRDHIIEIVKARQVIEPPIAALAALHHSAEDAERLAQDIEALKTSSGDYEELAGLDMRFHLNIAKASENPIIPLILEPIHKLMPQVKSSVYATVADAKESAIIWHQKILDQILARNEEGARTAMVEHLKIAEEHARILIASEKSGMLSESRN